MAWRLVGTSTVYRHTVQWSNAEVFTDQDLSTQKAYVQPPASYSKEHCKRNCAIKRIDNPFQIT
jgi:hypothetical protein